MNQKIKYQKRKTTKVGLIGYGYWGKKLGHTLASELGLVVSVFDPLAPTTPNQHFVFCSSLDEILNDTSISAVFIATPEQTHYQVVKLALQAHKHVFVEKPLCLVPEQATELMALAKQQKRVLFVDYVFLYDQRVLGLKQQTKSTILRVESTRHSQNIVKTNVNVIQDLLIHDIYLFRYFFDQPCQKVELLSFIENGLLQEAVVELSTGNQILQTHLSWNTYPKSRSLKIISQTDTVELLEAETMRINAEPVDPIHQPESPLLLVISDFLTKTEQKSNILQVDYPADVAVLQQIVTTLTKKSRK